MCKPHTQPLSSLHGKGAAPTTRTLAFSITQPVGSSALAHLQTMTRLFVNKCPEQCGLDAARHRVQRSLETLGLVAPTPVEDLEPGSTHSLLPCGLGSLSHLSLSFLIFILKFIYLWAASGLSCGTWDLLLWCAGSVVAVRGLSCPAARGILVP